MNVPVFIICTLAWFTWDHPTERIDESPLPANEIKGYEIYWYCDTTKNGQPRQGTITVNYPTKRHKIPTCEALGNCYASIAVIDTKGLISEQSNITKFTVLLKRPRRGGFR